MSTTHTSIAAWAASLGSKAKTRAGQRKAILSSHSFATRRFQHWGYSPIRAFDGKYLYRETTRAEYYAKQQRSRQEGYAQEVTQGLPLPATKESVRAMGTQIALTDLDHNTLRNYALVGGWYISLSEQRDYDYTYYAKSYGHPKVTVSDRTVHIRRVLPDGTMETRDVAVDTWRGNYLLDALIKSGVTTVQEGPKLSHIRLHPAYHLNLVRKGHTMTIYSRSLASEVVDYCAVWHGLTFHAVTIRAAIRGLRTKLHSVISAKNAPITWELGKRLGFCDEGMRQFVRDFDLDANGRYSADEIARRVQSDLPTAAKYETELRKLADAVGYAIPAQL